MTEELNDGATEGTYKTRIPNTAYENARANEAATLAARAGLNRLDGYDWSIATSRARGDGRMVVDSDA